MDLRDEDVVEMLSLIAENELARKELIRSVNGIKTAMEKLDKKVERHAIRKI